MLCRAASTGSGRFGGPLPQLCQKELTVFGAAFGRWMRNNRQIHPKELPVPQHLRLTNEQANAVIALSEALTRESFDVPLGVVDLLRGVDGDLLHNAISHYVGSCECGRAVWKKWPICVQCRLKMLG